MGGGGPGWPGTWLGLVLGPVLVLCVCVCVWTGLWIGFSAAEDLWMILVDYSIRSTFWLSS